MKLFLPIIVGFMSGLTTAAECSGCTGGGAPESAFWTLRDRMCSTTASHNEYCDYQQDCDVTIDWLTLSRRNRGPHGGFPNCWAATENIITQCRRNGCALGSWTTSEEFYEFRVAKNPK
ncbi:hypothetical protein BKA64DRAFT_745021 [Cadophora sp. MPI-SDFR-AT-0126]|nr:hypothetical protein BKA64DRAFT_745021 [Leotiomycetes sp. MPI-SDFR-AT-0126]